MNPMTPFEISYREELVQVIPRKIGVDMVFIVDFPSRRPPIMLSKATMQGGGHFWTTIPEEKNKLLQDAALKEAALIGELITKNYQVNIH